MSDKSLTMYTVVCDRCGVDACAEAEHSCWAEPWMVREMDCQEWIQVGDRDYCPNCIERNEDESELIPKTP